MNNSPDQITDILINHDATESIAKLIKVENGKTQGSLQVVVDADFDGTTSTITVLGSNDNISFGPVYKNDGTTPMALTPAASDNKTFYLDKLYHKWYSVVYAFGDATDGVIKAVFVAK